MQTRSSVFPVAGAIALCVVVAIVYSRLFAGADTLWTFIGAALVAGAITTATARWPATRAIGAAIAGFIVYGVEIVSASHVSHWVPDVTAWRAFGTGLVDGWKQLLTEALPASANGSTEIASVAVIWTAAAAAVYLACRPRTILAPLGPPTLAFAGGLVYAAAGPSPAVLGEALAFLVIGAVTALAGAQRREHRADQAAGRLLETDETLAAGPELAARRAGLVSRAVLAVPAAVMVALGSFGLTHAFPISSGTNRFDPKHLVHVSIRTEPQISPLALLDALAQSHSSQPLFNLVIRTPPGTTQPDRVRAIDLDTFNGAYWSSGANFELTGPRLAATPDSKHNIDETVGGLGQAASQLGPYVPVVGEPLNVKAKDFAYDPAGQQLATTKPSAQAEYRITAAPTPPLTFPLKPAVATSTVTTDPVLTSFPGIPLGVATRASRVISGQNTVTARIQAIVAYLRANERYSPSAPPGQSMFTIQTILDQSHVGTSGQLAEAFAVMARYAGIPTRVAIGYRLSAKDEIGPGVYQPRASDAYAWPEVDLSGYGWVPVDPVDPNQIAQVINNQNNASNPITTPPPATPAQIVNSNAGPAPIPFLPRRPGAPTVLALILGGIACFIILPPLAVAGAKARRRHRRMRTGTPAERIVGAWRETRDRVRDYGLALPWTLTPKECADAVDAHFVSAPPVAMPDLVALVTSVLYSPEPVDEGDAHQGWDLVEALREEMATHAGWSGRLRAAIDPRSLRTKEPSSVGGVRV